MQNQQEVSLRSVPYLNVWADNPECHKYLMLELDLNADKILCKIEIAWPLQKLPESTCFLTKDIFLNIKLNTYIAIFTRTIINQKARISTRSHLYLTLLRRHLPVIHPLLFYSLLHSACPPLSLIHI